jgi:hypothetical protein
MKDIKSEILKNMDESYLENVRKIQVLGVQRIIPKAIISSQIKNLNIYEIDDISDISKYKKELLKKVRVSFRVFFWSMRLYHEIRKSKLHKEYTKLYKKYGHIQREINSDHTTMYDVLLLRMQKKTLLYITNVQLRNFRQITSPLISAYTFDIVDSKNNIIQGTIKYDSFFDDILSPCDPDILKNRNILEAAKSESGHHYTISGMLLNGEYLGEHFKNKSRIPKILVTKISDGGRTQKLSIPLIKF